MAPSPWKVQPQPPKCTETRITCIPMAGAGSRRPSYQNGRRYGIVGFLAPEMARMSFGTIRGRRQAARRRGRRQRHRRGARAHRRRMVAAARVKHPGRAGGALRGIRRGRAGPAQERAGRPSARQRHRAAGVLIQDLWYFTKFHRGVGISAGFRRCPGRCRPRGSRSFAS